jgi:UDP-N-acetylglucosamine 4,6-dehydratase
MFGNRKLLITGGTGSFGGAVLRKLLMSNLSEIRIFSRDEKKQDDMRKAYKSSKIKFYLGDVRDYGAVLNAVDGVDYIFNAAALKQVPSCEFYPMEAFKTNVVGIENVLNAAIACSVKKVICLSTDKAVYPINAMGISKAMMEKVAVAKSRNSKSTEICITRYGNVMGSRGSVIPLFVNQIRENKNITITDPKMTRFMMSLEDAVNLVLFAFENGKSGDIFVQKSPASTVDLLARAILELTNVDRPLEIIGTRHGEKLFETLLSREEMAVAKDLTNFYRIPPDLRSLNYEQYIEVGDTKFSNAKDYNSHNTHQLTMNELKDKLIKSDIIAACQVQDLS